MGEERRRFIEGAFLFWGVITGAILGIFGNLFTNYFYDAYKTSWWMPYAGWGSYFVVLIFLIIMFKCNAGLDKPDKSDARAEDCSIITVNFTPLSRL